MDITLKFAKVKMRSRPIARLKDGSRKINLLIRSEQITFIPNLLLRNVRKAKKEREF